MSKNKNAGLDQYGAEHFEQQQFGTSGVEEVNKSQACVDETINHKTSYNGKESCHHVTQTRTRMVYNLATEHRTWHALITTGAFHIYKSNFRERRLFIGPAMKATVNRETTHVTVVSNNKFSFTSSSHIRIHTAAATTTKTTTQTRFIVLVPWQLWGTYIRFTDKTNHTLSLCISVHLSKPWPAGCIWPIEAF